MTSNTQSKGNKDGNKLAKIHGTMTVISVIITDSRDISAVITPLYHLTTHNIDDFGGEEHVRDKAPKLSYTIGMFVSTVGVDHSLQTSLTVLSRSGCEIRPVVGTIN